MKGKKVVLFNEAGRSNRLSMSDKKVLMLSEGNRHNRGRRPFLRTEFSAPVPLAVSKLARES
jgi:hypothetical protein